ncbi:MAG: DUF4115 domain-containing protein [Xanthomonadales bacterium]|nr:DUF4115 domain-containing protein [Xanthomonadales bacterium]
MIAAEANEHRDGAGGALPPAAAGAAVAGAPGFGARLAAARERAGLSRADVATRLKLPLQLIGRLEQDDYTGLTQAVFLRGYLTGYARLVGLSTEEAAAAAEARAEAVPLVATGTIPRSRYLFDRYSVSATYMVLTAIIVVPAVWLATHGGLEQNLARTAPLDPPAQVASLDDPQGTHAAGEALAGAPELEFPAPAVPTPEPALSPLVASMTPFTVRPPAPEPAAAPASTAPATGSGAHLLELRLDQQSWVEVTTADGRRLEYSMLSAGSHTTYRSDEPLFVRLGNAQGASIIGDGQAVDLAAFQRGNVAHVKLFGEGGAAVRPEQ